MLVVAEDGEGVGRMGQGDGRDDEAQAGAFPGPDVRPPLCSLQGEVSGVHAAAAKGGEGGPRAGAAEGARGEGVSAGGSSKTGWSLSAFNLFPAL